MAACKTSLPNRANRAPFSPSFRKEELHYCTEELGSESISCRGATACTATSMQLHQGHHGSLQVEACAYGERNAATKCTLPVVGLIPACKFVKSSPLMNDIPAGQATGKSCTITRSGNMSTMQTHAVRTFPPPISFLLSNRSFMRSFKSNGRFVLQRVDTSLKSPFRSVRGNGRLRLLLTSSCSGLDCNKKHKECEDGGSEEDERHEQSAKVGQARTKKGLCNGVELEMLQHSEEEKKLSFDHRLLTAYSAYCICMPRSLPARGWDANSCRAPYECWPTLRFLLEKAQGLSYYNVQAGVPLQLAAKGSQLRTLISPSCCAKAASSTQQLESLPSISERKTPGTRSARDGAIISKREHGYAILSLSFNGLLLLINVVLEGGKPVGMSMSFKGIDSYLPNSAGAPPGPGSSSVRAHHVQVQQPNCAELSKLDLISYHTWHTSKPIDFRIAA